MARRTVVAIPMPADIEDLLQVLTDVGRGWAAARLEIGPVTIDGDPMLILTASRRRAQRPTPGEDLDEEAEAVVIDAASSGVPNDLLQAIHTPGTVEDHLLPEARKGRNHDDDLRGGDDGAPTADPSEDDPTIENVPADPGAWLDAFDEAKA